MCSRKVLGCPGWGIPVPGVFVVWAQVGAVAGGECWEPGAVGPPLQAPSLAAVAAGGEGHTWCTKRAGGHTCAIAVMPA